MQCQITPISDLTAGLMVAIMVALVGASLFFGVRRDLALAARAIVVVALIGGTTVLGYFFVASYQSVVVADKNEIRLDIPIYGFTVSRDRLKTARVTVVDLDVQSDLALSRRTNGLGMFGYSVGWFTLANGSQAIAAITDRRRVVYLEQSDGNSIMFSCQDPARFVDFLLKSEVTGSDKLDAIVQ